jgi:hypothetical protein
MRPPIGFAYDALERLVLDPSAGGKGIGDKIQRPLLIRLLQIRRLSRWAVQPFSLEPSHRQLFLLANTIYTLHAGILSLLPYEQGMQTPIAVTRTVQRQQH